MEPEVLNLALCAWALGLGIYDQQRHRLPNAGMVLVLFYAVAWLVVFHVSPTGVSVGAALLGATAAFVLLLPGYAMRQVGAGDVKFLAIMGLYVGPTDVFIITFMAYGFLFAAYAGSLLYSQTRLAGVIAGTPAQRMPLGLALATGFVVQLYDLIGLGAGFEHLFF